MRKVASVLIVFSMILAMCVTSNAANTTIKLKVNGKVADLKGFNPYKSVSGIMVPLAEASIAIGASVEYVKNTKEAKVKLDKTVLVFKAGRRIVLVNGKSYYMGENAVNTKGKIYVPARFLYEKLGGTVAWDNKTNTVIVTIKLASDSATKPETKPSESINVSMPASSDFKPYIAELTPIPIDILEELKAYKDDKDGDDNGYKYKTPEGKGISYYMSNEDAIKNAGINIIEDNCATVKGLMEVENNIDYRTLENGWIQKYRYFFTPGININAGQKDYISEEYIVKRYSDIKQFKIVEKAEFITDTSLLYSNKNSDIRIRGRLKFMFESADPLYFKAYGLPKYDLNKWYYSDVELCTAIIFDSGTPWPHARFTYLYRVFLNNNLLTY